MKGTEFDALARELSSEATRRGFFRFLGGAAALGSGLLLAIDADAKKKGKHHGKANAQNRGNLEAQRRKGKGKGKGKKKKHGPRRPNRPNKPQPQGPVGPRFTVSGRSILDTNGNPVLLRGVNKMSVFDNEDPTGTISFPEIKKTGANTVRIVWMTATDEQPGGTNPGTMDALIANARASGLVPMIELHDATGNWGGLNNLVNYWTQPNIVNIIKKHQSYLLVNIGNEVGDDSVSDGQFISGYTNAVQRMRTAGIHTPLVIDAPDWGKNLETLNNTAAQLLAADPDHNLIFSVHLYWGVADGANAQFIKNQFTAAVAANYPLIVGEFSRSGAYDPNVGDSSCQAGGYVDYATIIQQCAQHGIGYYAWEWGPGNIYGGAGCDIMDMTPNRMFASLKSGWAKEVATTSPFSIKNTAQPII